MEISCINGIVHPQSINNINFNKGRLYVNKRYNLPSIFTVYVMYNMYTAEYEKESAEDVIYTLTRESVVHNNSIKFVTKYGSMLTLNNFFIKFYPDLIVENNNCCTII